MVSPRLILSLFAMKKINKPLVSIIMATNNRANQLDLTIKNIFEQSYSAVELVIINDGSSDGTFSTLENLHKKYDFITINILHQFFILIVDYSKLFNQPIAKRQQRLCFICPS